MHFIAQEVRELMAQLGFRTINEMVGRVDRLDVKKAIDHYKARGLDFSKVFHQPKVPAECWPLPADRTGSRIGGVAR